MRWLGHRFGPVLILAAGYLALAAFQPNGPMRPLDVMADARSVRQDDADMRVAGDLADDAGSVVEEGPGLDDNRPLECNRLPAGRAHDLCVEEQTLRRALERHHSSELIDAAVAD
ncbi:MAG TPA: hypothetical protein VF793_14255 [Telluria sp.]